MTGFVKKHWPVITATFFLWLVIAICMAISIKQNQGHIIYRDDAYIHMSMAKNFARSGTWGVSKHEFTSSSSSLLWTFLLAVIYFPIGTKESIPFVLNFVFASAACILNYIILKKYELKNFFIFIVLLSIIFFTPLVPLVFCGMEHTLHFLISIIFICLSAKSIQAEKTTQVESLLLIIFAALVTTARYEGLFLIFVVSCLFLIKKKPLPALVLAMVGIFPLIIYGLISVSKGWYLLPNSVLLKGYKPTIFSAPNIPKALIVSGVRRIARSAQISILILGAISLLFLRHTNTPRKKKWSPSSWMLIIFATTSLLHGIFAEFGPSYRYDAYLIGVGLLCISISIHEYLNQRLIPINKAKIITLALLALLIISPFGKRGLVTLKEAPQITTNIFEQHYQMGLFLKEFYQGKVVAANDIGAINYLADIKCVDLWGFANKITGAARVERRFGTQAIADAVNSAQVNIAIVTEHRFRTSNKGSSLPAAWIKVAKWTISNNIACSSNSVSFYAANQKEKKSLLNNLKKFTPKLPETIKQYIL